MAKDTPYRGSPEMCTCCNSETKGRCMLHDPKHTRGATEAAWVIMAGKAKIETEFGKKTLEGIADLIDRKTAAPDLLKAAKYALSCLTNGDTLPEWTIRECRAAIAKAEGEKP